MTDIKSLLKDYHVVVEDVATGEAHGFMLYLENGVFGINTLSSLASKISIGEETMGDLTNDKVFIQYNWSGHVAVETRNFVGPAGVKYRSPSFNYSQLLPTGAYWYGKGVDTTTQSGEIRVGPAALALDTSLDPEDVISTICDKIENKIYIGLKNKPQIYRYEYDGSSWNFNKTPIIDLSEIDLEIIGVNHIDGISTQDGNFLLVIGETQGGNKKVYLINEPGNNFWIFDQDFYLLRSIHNLSASYVYYDGDITVTTRANRNYNVDNGNLNIEKEFNDGSNDRYVLVLVGSGEHLSVLLPGDKITAYNANGEIVQYSVQRSVQVGTDSNGNPIYNTQTYTYNLQDDEVYGVGNNKVYLKKPYETTNDSVIQLLNGPIAYIKISEDSLKKRAICSSSTVRCEIPYDIYEGSQKVGECKVKYMLDGSKVGSYIDGVRVPIESGNGIYVPGSLYMGNNSLQGVGGIELKYGEFPLDSISHTYTLKPPKYIYRKLDEGQDIGFAVIIGPQYNGRITDFNFGVLRGQNVWYYVKVVDGPTSPLIRRTRKLHYNYNNVLSKKYETHGQILQYLAGGLINTGIIVRSVDYTNVIVPIKDSNNSQSTGVLIINITNGIYLPQTNICNFDNVKLADSSYIYGLDYKDGYILGTGYDTGGVYLIYYNGGWISNYHYITDNHEGHRLIGGAIMGDYYYIPNPLNNTLYRFSLTTYKIEEVASIIADQDNSQYFPIVFVMGDRLIIESNKQKTFYYKQGEMSKRGYLVSSIYGGYLGGMEKVWLYARIQLKEQKVDYGQKIRLAVSFDDGKTFYNLPRVKGLPLILDNFDGEVSPEYEYTYNDLIEKSLAIFYFPFGGDNELNRNKSTHICYKVEMYRGDAPVEDFAVKIVELYYNIDTYKEYLINLKFLLQPAQQLVSKKIETPRYKHLEKLEFLKKIYNEKRVVKIYMPWGESMYAIPFEAGGGGFGITTIENNDTKLNPKDFSYVIGMTFKSHPIEIYKSNKSN